jgi:hypothetical protein
MNLETLAPLKLNLEGQHRDLQSGMIIILIDYQGWKLLAKLPHAIRRLMAGHSRVSRPGGGSRSMGP